MKKCSVLTILLVNLLALFAFVAPAGAAGNRIVFSSDRTGTQEIFTMDEDGSNITQATSLGATSSLASWIPSSNSILFRSNSTGNYDLFTVNSDGTGLTNRTNSPGDESGSLASPNGSHVAYLRDDGGGTFSLNVLNLSDNTTSLVNAGFTGFWWLSETELVIYENQGSGWELYRMNTDGTGKTPLTNDTGNSFFATVSPDGQRIAYFYSDVLGSELRVMDSDGTNQATLTPISDSGISSTVGLPMWSPDSTKLLFLFNDTGSTNPLMRIAVDGSGLNTLGSITGSGLWGPTGENIWYSQPVSGFTELFTADTTGNNAVNLTNSGANNEIFLSAFVFQSGLNDPDPETPPATSIPSKPPVATLAASGTSLATATGSLLILGSILGLRARRTRYFIR